MKEEQIERLREGGRKGEAGREQKPKSRRLVAHCLEKQLPEQKSVQNCLDPENRHAMAMLKREQGIDLY